MSKHKAKSVASSSYALVPPNTEVETSMPPKMGCYTDPKCRRWYGKKRKFYNKPIWMHDQWENVVGHVMVGKVYSHKPDGVIIVDTNLKWRELYDERCTLEVYCRWHGLKVPQARSADICRDQSRDEAAVIKSLTKENAQMRMRLERFHLRQKVEKEAIDVNKAMTEIIEDPSMVSDPELSDFSDESDDDFANYLPTSLCHNGKPMCCHLMS
jgi:hypothetical protein